MLEEGTRGTEDKEKETDRVRRQNMLRARFVSQSIRK